ncbi:MgtC/SapB family protein [Pseudodonghicola xiamenensis]|uniref:Membrane protein n=1 Tax=Pseudodonghicola xiamenensis TaxID=337702 RepID=A0A8J3MED1_9RHOB|nr:MgtC/SapB family protein [Pseudodonghicola xiamenensis]GHG97191.1 membrane protein [Pseudodonghicola xiamenensis]
MLHCMDEIELFRRLGLALGIGLLLGLERGWHAREDAEGSRAAGLRTFALVGLLGGLCGWISLFTSPLFLGFAFLALTMLVAVAYWVQIDGDDDLGLTTEVALLLTFALGAVALLGDMAVAAASAVMAVALLSLKRVLHGWVARIRRFELAALLQLAVISVVILPLLPRQGYGPGGTLNPYELWWAVVLVAGLSFLGYVAMRVAGARVGAAIAGLFGGLASSTSTTLALSRMVRGDSGLGPSLAVGVVLAGAVTFLRVLIVGTIFCRDLLGPLAWPLGVMGLTGLVGAGGLALAARPQRKASSDLKGVTNPLALGTALTFGAVLVVVLLGTYYLRLWFGEGGVYVVAALSGLTDVDALTISVARLSRNDLALQAAAVAIVLAVSVNTSVKGLIALVVGGRDFGLRVLGVYAIVLAAGGATIWLSS